jgi:hypothetical protein
VNGILNASGLPGDDVGGSQAVAHALARVSTGTDCGVDRARLATDQDGDIAAADELATDQPHLGRLGHGVGSLDRGDEAPGLDHAQGNARNVGISILVGHLLRFPPYVS